MELTHKILTISLFRPYLNSVQLLLPTAVDHLDEISVVELQHSLTTWRKRTDETVVSGNSAQTSVTQTELAEWSDVQRRTIYSWLK